MNSILDLLFGQSSEEVDFVGAWGSPLVVGLESGLEVRLNVHIKGLGLQLTIGWVVHTRHCLRRRQVMQVLCQL